VNRITITISNADQAAALDRLVSRFAEDLAQRSNECVFYLTQPGDGASNRVVETESFETLQRFIAFVSPHLALDEESGSIA
jgi:hypothetical protein